MISDGVKKSFRLSLFELSRLAFLFYLKADSKFVLAGKMQLSVLIFAREYKLSFDLCLLFVRLLPSLKFTLSELITKTFFVQRKGNKNVSSETRDQKWGEAA